MDLSSVHYCKDRFHIHVFNRSSNIWLPYIHNRLFTTSWVYLEPTHWPALSWLGSSVGRALHRYPKGHGFKSLPAWIFFRPSFYYYLSSVHYCEDRFHIQEMLLFAHLEKQLHGKDRLWNQTDTKICDCKATKHDLWRRTKRRNRTKSSHTRNKEPNKSVMKSQCNKSV